jgi:hypothetical protein
MSDSNRRSFYLTIFASLAFTLLYCLTVYLIWPSIGDYRTWNNYVMAKDLAVRRIGDSPKIIFTGGSATLYGVRAKDVERTFGIPTVNYAFNAGLGLDYILYTVKKIAKKGDVVILPLEYEHFLYDGATNSFKASFILSGDREYFLHGLSFRKKLENLFSIIAFNKVFKAFKRSRSRQPNPWPLGTLNQNGDITGNVGNRRLEEISPTPLPNGELKETEGLLLIKEFSCWAAEKGITVYVSYANRVYVKDYEREAYVRYFENLRCYFVRNNIRFIGTPYDFFYPVSFFYDTEYHLNEDGVTLRTETLMRMLTNTDPKVFKVRNTNK